MGKTEIKQNTMKNTYVAFSWYDILKEQKTTYYDIYIKFESYSFPV